MIKISNLNFAYPKRGGISKQVVFENFSLTIKKGKLTSILGHSGCGKTTLINLIAGYLKPNRGVIEKSGQKILGPGRDRFVINQENDLFDWMTVYENVKFCSNGAGSVDDCLKIVGLNEFKLKFPNELSGGMKKRVSFARAMIVNPDCLIMDEPFASIDYKKRNQLYKELLRFIKKNDKAIILVTHDIDEAINLSDEIIILKDNPVRVRSVFEINKNSFSNKKLLNLKRKIKSIFGEE